MIIGREREITRGWDASRQSGGSFCMEWNRDGWKEEVIRSGATFSIGSDLFQRSQVYVVKGKQLF